MSGPMFERTSLPDGPRVISARLPGTRSLAVAVYVLVGSRMESRDRSGLAHFMEHITFKGTRSLPGTRQVSEAVEGVGGMCNAATDRESTVYWTRLPVREAGRAFHVLSELVLRPLLRTVDIARERDIIVEEIRSYRDDPGHLVFNLWDEAFFGDSPLGWEIAGDETTVRALDDAAIRDFWASGYRPSNMVVAAAGDMPHAEVVDLTERAFGTGNGSASSWAPAPPQVPHERVRVLRKASSQAHLCLGLPALPRDHPDQWVLELLTTILGDGSSSRLFLRVREEAGLAYDVHAFQTDYADCGTLQVYAGVDPADTIPAVRAILGELARLRDEAVPGDELEKARNYAIGRLELRVEESRHMAAFLGTQEALHRDVLGIDEVIAALREVTTEDVRALAARLFRDDGLALALIAPRGGVKGLDRALRLP
jgi:predicted Zn-dependent peptidase